MTQNVLYYKCKQNTNHINKKKQEENKMKATTKISEKEEIVTITDEKLLCIIEDRQSYKNLIDEAEKLIKEFDKAITEAVEKSGSNTIMVGCHKVTMSKYTRETVSAKDVKKLVSDEVFEQLVNRKLSTRLTVK